MPKLYTTCGTEDFLFSANELLYEKVKNCSVSPQFEKFRGIHDWNFWDKHIQDVLNWPPL